LKNKEALPDWSGKCISMNLIDEPHSHDLENPHFKYHGGRLFIIGTIPDMATDSGWSANQIGGVAWDLVRDNVLFENLDSYIEGVRKSEEYNKAKKEKSV
jgi:hypothetical protein